MKKEKSALLRDILRHTNLRYNLALLAYTLSSLAVSLIIGQSIRMMLGHLQSGRFEDFLRVIAWGLPIFLAVSLAGYFTYYAVLSQSERLGLTLYCSLFRKIWSLPLPAIEKYGTGDLHSRLMGDIRSAVRVYRLDASYILKVLILGVGNGVMIFLIDWRMGLLALGFGLLEYAVNRRFLAPMRDTARRLAAGCGSITGTLLEMTRGSAVIRVFGLQDWMDRRFDLHNQKMREDGLRLSRIQVGQGAVNTLFQYTNVFLFLILSILLMYTGQLHLGDVVAGFYYAQSVITMFNDLGTAFANLQRSYASILRIDEVQRESSEAEPAVSLETAGETAIEFDNVTFGYQKGQPVLKDLSFQVTPGEWLLLRGRSGSGKSTILKLLLGLYDGWEGHIRIFGRDMREMSPCDARRLVAYMPQEPFFFQGTFYENIAVARPDASREEVEEAARRASLDDFIRSLPKGYETDIGEAGGQLSGGQRQRLSMARAFLKDAPILVLDEPLSAVDHLNAQAFYETLEKTMKSKTILMVSHRRDDEDGQYIGQAKVVALD